jgi:transposase-like protein
MAVFTGGAQGTLVRLRCPRCGEVQARAKKPGGGGAKYRCRVCHTTFTRDAGVGRTKPARRKGL